MAWYGCSESLSSLMPRVPSNTQATLQTQIKCREKGRLIRVYACYAYINVLKVSKLHRHIIGFPIDTNYDPPFLCYERKDVMLPFSDDTQAEVIEFYNSSYRYLDDLLNIANNFFDSMVLNSVT